MEPVLHQITHWQDLYLPAVLDLYQTSFPPNEQMRLSWWVELLNELSLQNGPSQMERLLYAILGDDSNDVVGFAYCEVYRAKKVAYLMYLATRDDLRGRGIGAAVYQQVTEELFSQRDTEVLLFEVEKPEIMAAVSPDSAETARRRIDWYERQGARLIENVCYVQSVGWQPPIEMNLMFHGKSTVTREQAVAAAGDLFGNCLTDLAKLP